MARRQTTLFPTPVDKTTWTQKIQAFYETKTSGELPDTFKEILQQAETADLSKIYTILLMWESEPSIPAEQLHFLFDLDLRVYTHSSTDTIQQLFELCTYITENENRLSSPPEALSTFKKELVIYHQKNTGDEKNFLAPYIKRCCHHIYRINQRASSYLSIIKNCPASLIILLLAELDTLEKLDLQYDHPLTLGYIQLLNERHPFTDSQGCSRNPISDCITLIHAALTYDEIPLNFFERLGNLGSDGIISLSEAVLMQQIESKDAFYTLMNTQMAKKGLPIEASSMIDISRFYNTCVNGNADNSRRSKPIGC